MHFSPRPVRKPFSAGKKKKDEVPFGEWYAAYKERVRKAATTLRETFYSFILGEKGSPLSFECLHWDGKEKECADEIAMAHVGVATESVDRAWVTLVTGKSAIRRESQIGPSVDKKVSTPPEGRRPDGGSDPPTVKEKGKDYRIYNDSEAEIESSSLFAYYVGAERLSGILKEDSRGPAPYISVRVAAITTVVDDITTKQNINVKTWKDEVTTEMVAKPLLFAGTYNNTPVRVLYDPGSGAQIMSKSFAEGLRVSTLPIPSPIRLRYPDGQSGMTRDRSSPGTIRIGRV